MSTARPLVVGIAGKCCAGKDEVVSWLAERDWREINVDRIGHNALAVLHSEIVAAFGRGIVGSNGTIDRTLLGAVVFRDRSELARLEAIVHPWMRERVAEEARAFRAACAAGAGDSGGSSDSGDSGDSRDGSASRGLIINAALLFPMRLDTLCDRIILVTAPLATRIARARARDGATWRRIMQRLWTQRRLNTQARSSSADILMVENGSTREALYAQLSALPDIP